MKSELKLLKVSISNILGLIKGLSNEQMNKIPEGFANNLIWHVAHLLVTQKLLLYGLSNNDLNLSKEFVERYKKGSKPNGVISDSEITQIKSEFEKLYSTLIKDLELEIFKTFKNYPTSYNFEITNLNDAITFNNLHFGLHVSSILKLKKQVLS